MTGCAEERSASFAGETFRRSNLVVKSLRELARREVDSSYASRMDNPTTPASAIVAAVLNKTLPPDLIVFDLTVDPPALCEE